MSIQDNSPESMAIEELDLRYGKPEKMPLVWATLAVASNENHDIVMFEILNEAG